MADGVARGIAALALVGLFANGVLWYRLDGRLQAIQTRFDERAAQRADGPPARVVGERAAPVRGDMGERRRHAEERAAALLGADPDAVRAIVEEADEERSRARRERWDERIRESTQQEVAAFAKEHGLDAATEQAVREELLLLQQGMSAIREDMSDDRISLFDGRKEMRALFEDSDARMVELLGEQQAAALRESVGGGMRGRGGPPGRP